MRSETFPEWCRQIIPRPGSYYSARRELRTGGRPTGGCHPHILGERLSKAAALGDDLIEAIQICSGHSYVRDSPIEATAIGFGAIVEVPSLAKKRAPCQ